VQSTQASVLAELAFSKTMVYGFSAGDEVQSLIEFDSPYCWISKGDRGTVRHVISGKTKLSVEIHGAYHAFAPTDIKKVELSYGFVAGDDVTSLVNHEDWLKKGDKGKVIGPSRSDGADKDRRVLVKFANAQEINMLAAKHIKKIELVYGFVVGDDVTSLIKFGDWLQKGDKGRVIGPCNSEKKHASKYKRVLVAFANGKQVNMSAASHIKKVELANGFVAGDDIESLIKHQDWLLKGDKGRVIGPATSDSPDNAQRVLVEFANSGKRINVVAALHIKKTDASEGSIFNIEERLRRISLEQQTSLISHTHGRQRRAERGIEKEDLKNAIKLGRKERANPGRDGKPRWRYSHKGVVFITDETSKHEITSWRLDGAADDVLQAEVGHGACRSHTVIIVDHSGSMRKGDVQGHKTRTAAVYDCLIRDFVRPQIETAQNQKKGAPQVDAVVTLISMSDDAKVLFERQPFGEAMVDTMNQLKQSRACSHGNYLPALDKAIEVLDGDAYSGAQVFLVFLSDGAPSDHCHTLCSHGVEVWQDDTEAKRRKNGKFRLKVCESDQIAQTCRKKVIESVRSDCVKRISRLGDLFGRDRTFIGTVAFGPLTEDYQVLQEMAAKLPRNSFQKLGLSTMSLKTAFSSLTSDLTTLNTQMAGKSLTLRDVKQQEAGTKFGDIKWDIYKTADPEWTLVGKLRWSIQTRTWMRVPLGPQVVGFARSKMWKKRGGERYVFDGFEINTKNMPVGSELIVKEAAHTEYLSADFHKRFCRMQSEAEKLATSFNSRLNAKMGAHPEWQVHFLQCVMYEVKDSRYEGGCAYYLAESLLDGNFSKWNNNSGTVRDVIPETERQEPASLGIGVIAEEDEEEEDAEDDDAEGLSSIPLLNQVPQCFSHFTYSHCKKKKLVCDVQGVWNKVDGFMLTDPVFHSTDHRHKNGGTDKGTDGIRNFFQTHKCGTLCRRLGLEEMKICADDWF
jgi:hypothetical protein